MKNENQIIKGYSKYKNTPIYAKLDAEDGNELRFAFSVDDNLELKVVVTKATYISEDEITVSFVATVHFNIDQFSDMYKDFGGNIDFFKGIIMDSKNKEEV